MCIRDRLHLGGGIGGIHRVERSALLHDIALLKAAGQHLAGHQRLDAVSNGRLQRASAAERVGDIPGLRHCFCIEMCIRDSGKTPNEAYEKNVGTYGRFSKEQGAVKYIDPREE